MKHVIIVNQQLAIEGYVQNTIDHRYPHGVVCSREAAEEIKTRLETAFDVDIVELKPIEK